MTAALDACVQQRTAHVPLSHDEAGTWRVPLGEAVAVLPFSRHVPEALGAVERLEALQTRIVERAPPSPRVVALQEGP